MNWCSFIGHKWGKYEKPIKRQLTRHYSYTNKVVDYDALIQIRYCERCGKFDYREV